MTGVRYFPGLPAQPWLHNQQAHVLRELPLTVTGARQPEGNSGISP